MASASFTVNATCAKEAPYIDSCRNLSLSRHVEGPHQKAAIVGENRKMAAVKATRGIVAAPTGYGITI